MNQDRSVVIAFLIFLTLVMFFVYAAEAQVLEVGTPLSVITQQGSDGLYYLQCTSGCAEFYAIATIDILYKGYQSSFEAIETFVQLQYAYYGWGTYTPPQG